MFIAVFAAKITLDGVVGVDRFADLQHFRRRKILHATAVIDAQLVGDFDGLGEGRCRECR
jgi:hypothetical protein